jgi:hypothetical protein
MNKIQCFKASLISFRHRVKEWSKKTAEQKGIKPAVLLIRQHFLRIKKIKSFLPFSVQKS